VRDCFFVVLFNALDTVKIVFFVEKKANTGKFSDCIQFLEESLESKRTRAGTLAYRK
jgi:hypothetical protein